MYDDHYHIESDNCLFCMTKAIDNRLMTLKENNLRLATENIRLQRKLEEMDKSYKKLIKAEKSLEKDTKKVLAKDAKRDSLVKAGKKAKKMKGKC